MSRPRIGQDTCSTRLRHPSEPMLHLFQDALTHACNGEHGHAGSVESDPTGILNLTSTLSDAAQALTSSVSSESKTLALTIGNTGATTVAACNSRFHRSS